jgi:hypothetical protein
MHDATHEAAQVFVRLIGAVNFFPRNRRRRFSLRSPRIFRFFLGYARHESRDFLFKIHFDFWKRLGESGIRPDYKNIM